MEIRPIRHQEADTFLRLMCSAFDLDVGRARSVFFSEPYFDLSRKWALFDGDRMVSVLTTTPLLFGWGNAVGIAGVATAPEDRGQGHAAALLRAVMSHSAETGEGAFVLFARDPRLYETLGFETVDQVVRGMLDVDDRWESLNPMPFEQVAAIYSTWSQEDPSRLVRDAQRWRHWQWHFRACAEYGDGYLASEPGVLREAVIAAPAGPLPLPIGTEWFGLESLSSHFKLTLENVTPELHVMTHSCPSAPVMFMTDQF